MAHALPDHNAGAKVDPRARQQRLLLIAGLGVVGLALLIARLRAGQTAAAAPDPTAVTGTGTAGTIADNGGQAVMLGNDITAALGEQSLQFSQLTDALNKIAEGPVATTPEPPVVLPPVTPPASVDAPINTPPPGVLASIVSDLQGSFSGKDKSDAMAEMSRQLGGGSLSLHTQEEALGYAVAQAMAQGALTQGPGGRLTAAKPGAASLLASLIADAPGTLSLKDKFDATQMAREQLGGGGLWLHTQQEALGYAAAQGLAKGALIAGPNGRLVSKPAGTPAGVAVTHT